MSIVGALIFILAMAVIFRIVRYFYGRRVDSSSLESRFIIELSDAGVRCTDPHGRIDFVIWDELHKVEILTTDEGPFAPDVFWVLHAATTHCVIPKGASGEKELLDRLQSLPGFRNEVMIEAMGSTDNRTFVVWEKQMPPLKLAES